MAASSKALSTSELLEAILLELPLPKVLVIQRVCKSWEKTITKSPAIQQQFFYKSKTISSKSTEQKPKLNPVLSKLLGNDGNFILATPGRLSVSGSFCHIENYCVHPGIEGLSVYMRLTDIDHGLIQPTRAGSWESMFLTNQPSPVRLVRCRPDHR